MTTSPTPVTLPAPEATQAWLDDLATARLDLARELVAALKADPPGDTLAALRRWNDLEIAMSDVAAVASLFSEVHPLEPVRTRAEVAIQDVQKLQTEIGLDRELFQVYADLDPAGLDESAARLLERIRRDFRRAGVDRDETTRTRIREINDRMVLVGQEFNKNIRDDVRTIRVEPAALAGLPQDWLAAHPVGADGLVTVTTDYPDVVPVSTYGTVRETRRALREQFLNRAWPANDALLHELFDLRQELAGLLGYADWAEFDAEVKMIGSGAAIPVFVDKIAAVSLESGLRDRAVLLERVRADRPDAVEVDGVDAAHYEEIVRREHYDVDAQQVRAFCDFTKVRQGLLDVTGRLFGLSYRPVTDAAVWHPDVAAYDVVRAGEEGTEGAGKRLGRIYLDLHPREGKYKHAAQFDLRSGVAGRALPEGVLVCNFSRGLMEFDHVTTLFHEFGHLLHHVLGGAQEWVRFSGVATEWDFVEAPSQMLEEWAWDADILQTFATDEGGTPIPRELVEKMRRADDFGKGYKARTQMFYAALSYALHVERPADITARAVQLQEQYSLFPYQEGTHFTASFGHLEGYSSAYYTYMWSLVIAKDLFSAFDRRDLFEPTVAARYRDRVLARGGSRDAAVLVSDFLGRPYTFDAYAAWLAE